jgi:hypothetical protein
VQLPGQYSPANPACARHKEHAKNPRTNQKMRPTRFAIFNNGLPLIINYNQLAVNGLASIMNRTCSGRICKAQISIEFMILFIFFVGILAFAMVSVMQNIQDTSSSTLGLETKKTLSLVKSKLDTAFLEGDGFSTNFSLPQQIMNLDYSVNISSGFVLIEISNLTYSSPLITKDITGIPIKGENVLRNINGRLVIS